jgi:hypothetical protein
VTGVATFTRLRIDGGVSVSHTIEFSAPGFGPVTSDPITPVATPSGDVQVDETTEFQLWDGIYPTASVAWAEQTQAALTNDWPVMLALVAELLGPATWIVSWRSGQQSTTDWVTFYGPWPDPTDWPSARDALGSNWELGATIWHTLQQNDIDLSFLPARNAAETAGFDPPRMQLLLQTVASEPAAFRPTGAGGDGDGSRYAAIVLDIFQWMDATYGFVPDEIGIANEPNIIGNWGYTDEAFAMRATADLLAANGYTPRFVSAQNSTEGASLAHFDAVAAAANGIAAGIPEAFTWHRYGGQTLANRQAIAARLSDPFPGLMTEWIVSSGTVAQSFEQVVTEAEGSAWAQLNILDYIRSASPGDGNPVVTPGTRYIPEYLRHLRRGARRVASTEAHGSIGLALAWVRPDGKHVVTVRSTAAIGSFTIAGLPAGTYDVSETTAAVERQAGTPVVVTNGGTATVSASAAGVISLVRQ